MSIDLKFLLTDCLPETCLGIWILLMTLLPFIFKRDISQKMYYLFLFAIVSLFGFVWKSLVGTTYLFNGFFITDFSTTFFKIFLLITLLFFAVSYRENLTHEKIPSEIFVMLLLHLMGGFQSISANDFITLFLGLELMNMSLYICLALGKMHDSSREAISKYFILSAVSSCFILFGISWIYGLTGSTSFSTLERIFELTDYDQTLMTLMSFVFVIVGMSFKLLLAPLHFWAPQVYKKLSFFQIALLGGIPKIVFYFVLLKICACFMHSALKDWSLVMVVISITSMIFGGFTALVTTNLRKFIAYSSVGQLGFALIGFSSIAESGYTDSLMYFVNYTLSFLGFVCMLGLFERHKVQLEKISDISKIRNFSLSWIVLISFFILNMAGIPPFPGFIFKLHLINGLVLQNQYMHAFLSLVYSLISAVYYLKFIKYLFFSEQKEDLYALPEVRYEGAQKILKQNSSWVYLILVVMMISFMARPNFFISKFEKVISNLIFY